MRFSLRFLLIAAPLVALAFATVIWVVRGINYGIYDAYAEMRAVAMVKGYMEEHDGQWPRDWDDLIGRANGMPTGWSAGDVEFVSRRIQIDFDADVAEMRRSARSSSRPKFNVIWAKYPTGVHIGGGPNAELYAYFRKYDKTP